LTSARRAHFAEQLLGIKQRDLLTLADFGERHRVAAMLYREVQHRGYRKPPFSSLVKSEMLWSRHPVLGVL